MCHPAWQPHVQLCTLQDSTCSVQERPDGSLQLSARGSISANMYKSFHMLSMCQGWMLRLRSALVPREMAHRFPLDMSDTHSGFHLAFTLAMNERIIHRKLQSSSEQVSGEKGMLTQFSKPLTLHSASE